MRDDLYSPTVTAETTRNSAARPSLARQLGASLRWAIVGLGVVLISVGAYWAFHICSAMLQAVRDPASLEPAVTSMARLIDAEQLVLPGGEQRVAVGKMLTLGTLLSWYAVSAWIALAVLWTGAKLVLAVIQERRDFHAAVKEFLISVRHEGLLHGSTPPKR